MLVEFASVVDAVRCAVAVQQAMPERNTGVGADNRVELRIGINLGDVIVEGDQSLRRRRQHRRPIALLVGSAAGDGRGGMTEFCGLPSR
jgi:hypothetical protein